MAHKIKIKSILSNPDFKVLQLSGESGDHLKEHKVNTGALLLMEQGEIEFKDKNGLQRLESGACHYISAELFHEVQCISAARFFIVIQQETKMRFKK